MSPEMDEGEKPLSCAASEEPHTKDGAKHTQSYLPMELRGAESGSGADKFCIREGKVGPGTKLDLGSLSWRVIWTQHSWMETANMI